MKTYFEIDKKFTLEEATTIAKEKKKIGRYDFCDLINFTLGIDWIHPDRLKNRWVFVLSKKDKITGLAHEDYPLFGCPHGLGKECMICPKIEEEMSRKAIQKLKQDLLSNNL